MDSIDVAVIGAGVVGLAIARATAALGLETLVLERNAHPGEETTSRNSGVIHSGIYYPNGSLKARLCVRGREMLYALCRTRAVSHRRCGKLIVAGESQVAALHALHERARANGVTDLVELDAEAVGRLEPEVRCVAALHSPSTGIIDVHELLLALLADLEAAGGSLILKSTVRAVRLAADSLVVMVESDHSVSELRCKWLVNCAGLAAVSLLQHIQGYPRSRLRQAYYAKGNYFACHGVRPFRRLVYPMPNEAGLGIHATLDMDGTTRFGPDVEWVEQPDYRVDPQRGESFYAAIREYWPTIPAGSLQPAYAGVRPKLVGPGFAAGDFDIEDAAAHGIPGLINLLGIESPGLTSSLAIGEHVALIISGKPN
ncbi:FAD-dependent oxidoreductase [Steroidobacter denitrificans]|uniref:FAD-dependent oxidoreductase n=1 Tax=Steroidobacter denitrificans TaxID=465721 RepID=A0A127FAI4_STEDE|nr:NAD(P)/FAD-dependent oxidoreductase [Steroidobacter denitrificans]AMN47433.1 FAD-dependent oxidoreductase [Steroidobacter denitrificans]